LDDADGDGVTDQFDHEPIHLPVVLLIRMVLAVIQMVMAYLIARIKNLSQPTQCQPVDADGVGKCPDPACCRDNKMQDWIQD